MSDRAASKAWTIDAIDLDIPPTVDELSRVLHLNRSIYSFINPEGSSRDIQFLVVGPKGSGKTLLLKAKRVAIEEKDRGCRLIPRNTLQDRPSGDSPLQFIQPSSRAGKIRQLSFWKSAWLSAIRLSVVKEMQPGFIDKFSDPLTKRIKRIPVEVTPSDIFIHLMGLSDDEYFRSVANIQDQIAPLYRAVRSSAAIFIDNLDDYFSAADIESEDVHDTKFRRDIWVLAQLGLAEAISELRGANSQIRIFASLRIEALMRGYNITSNIQQIFGNSLDIRYTKDELHDIFEKNIAMMESKHLRAPNAKDPIERFIGSENIFMTHTYTGKREHFFDFIIRHSLGRPRDVIEIGKAIQRIGTTSDVDVLRNAVFSGAKRSVLRHFQDMKPFVHVPDHSVLFKQIKKNKLTFDELKEASDAYNGLMLGATIPSNDHPFCSLYKMGLLGLIDTNYETSKIQKFKTPDDFEGDQFENILPIAKIFLMHPALDGMINESRSGDYRLNFDRKNIVGDGLPWKDGDGEQFIITGDIVKSSSWMTSAEFSTITPRLFREWADDACQGLHYHQVTKGDSVLMIDESPALLIQAARKLSFYLADFKQFPRKIRFGGSSGVVQFEDIKNGKTIRISGVPLLTAARLEPHARHNSILATESFIGGAIEFGLGIDNFKLVLREELNQFSFENGEFFISKTTDDAQIKSRLWHIIL